MTRVTSLSIPPSLLELYNKILVPTDRYDQPGEFVQLRGTVRNPITIDSRPLILQRAHAAAAWLGDQHASSMSHAARQDFETQRTNEIMARSFVAPYWSAGTVLADETQDAVVTCVPDPGGVDPAYADPIRQASWCTMYYVNTSYANPPAHSSPPSPSAGWYGEVDSLFYTDVWYAQKRLAWSFPVNIGSAANQPLFVDLSYTLEMSSSFRGNKMWASVTIAPTITNFLPPYVPPWEPSRAFLLNKFIERLPLSPATTPWSQTITTSLPLDARFANVIQPQSNANKIVLYVSPIPAHGRYFSRNDTIQVWLTTTASAYYATGP